MQLFVLERWFDDYEFLGIEGVFSSRASAEAFLLMRLEEDGEEEYIYRLSESQLDSGVKCTNLYLYANKEQKHMKHTFESEQQVTDMLKERFDDQEHKINIEWFSHTLFINFDADSKQSEKSARLVWHYLVDQFGLEHVRISKYADNYVIDFV